jgi:hypothetical protein
MSSAELSPATDGAIFCEEKNHRSGTPLLMRAFDMCTVKH